MVTTQEEVIIQKIQIKTMNKREYPTIFLLTAHLLFTILFIYSTIVAKNFFYPLALGILFAYLLFPIANFLENIRIPRIFANLLSIIFGVGLLTGVFYLIGIQLEKLITDFPALKQQAMKNIDALEVFIENNLGVSQSNQKQWMKDNVGRLFDTGSEHIGQIFKATTGSIVRVGLLPVFVFFLLFYRDKAYDFILMITRSEKRDLVKHILFEISGVTKNYIGGVVIVVGILCILNSIGLYIVGVEYALMLGIIAACCNFIPYFGTIIGFMFPFVFSLVTGTPQTAIGVVILFVIVQFTENNILTPNIVGGNVKLNPFIVILGLIVGAMVWGVPGMLVIVPLIAVIRIICENIESLHPYAYLIGTQGAERHSVSLNNFKRIFRFLRIKRKRRKNSKKNNS